MAALIGALVILVGCATPGADQGSTPVGGSGLAEWSDGLLDRLVDADGSYGWQLCQFDADGAASLRMVGAVSPTGGQAVSQAGTSDTAPVTRVAIEAGDATISYAGGPWQPSDDKVLADIELAPLRSIDGVTALFDLEATVADSADRSIEHQLVERVPTGDGGSTLRLEGQGDGWLAGPQNEDAVAARQRLSRGPGGVWLLDTWADGERVERVRYQQQAWSPLAVEMLFLPIEDTIVDGVLQ